MDNQEVQGQRNRSPAYPYLSLKEVAEYATMFFKKYRNNHIAATIALADINITASSGSGVRVISALTQFGLFDAEGVKEARKIWLTDLGKSIAWGNPSDPTERIEAVQQAALKPNIHQAIYSKYALEANDLPPDDVLEYDLQRDMGFTDKAAVALVKEFKETFQYAGLDTLIRTELPKQRTENKIVQESNPSPDFISNIFGPPKPAMNNPQPDQASTDTRELKTSLTRGKMARLTIPIQMNRGDYEILVGWLELIKKAEFYEEDSESPIRVDRQDREENSTE